MKKSKIIQIIIISIICAWIFDIFIGRLLTAKLSTWPVLNRFHILTPQAPIVINNREVVREIRSGDLVAATRNVKSKLSLIVSVDKEVKIISSAINLTSDGLFVSGQSLGALSQPAFVVLSDGQFAQVASSTYDIAAGITFIKANFFNVPVAELSDSSLLMPGEQLIFTHNSLESFANKFTLGLVNAQEQDNASQIFSSDFYSRKFSAQAFGPLLEGEAIVNSQEKIVGFWNGKIIVSSNVLKNELSKYLSESGTISHSKFGFSYRLVGKSEAGLLKLNNQGYKITSIEDAQAAKNNFQVDDIILSVNDQEVSKTKTLEEILQNLSVGKETKFNILRADKTLTLSFVAQEIK